MRISKTRFLLGLVAGSLLVSSAALASPLAAPGSGITRQPDGSILHLHQRGSTSATWFETDDGYVVLRDASGQWVYAGNQTAKNLSGDLFTPTQIVVGRDDPAVAGIQPHLVSTHQSESLYHHVAKAVSGSNPIDNVTGTIPLLVVLGYYDDARTAANCIHCATTPVATFQSTIFGVTQSVTHYLNTVSQGALTVVAAGESEGTADDGIVGWLRLGATTPQGTSSTTTSYKSNRIAADALNGAMNYVDFTAFDSNHDGTVTSLELSIVIVVGGYEASYGRDARGALLTDDTTSPRLWGQSRSFVPAFSGVAAPTQSKNGRTVTINTTGGGLAYSIVGELHGNHGATMGIITHELGHSMLALPDLYDVSGGSYGIGVWSLMSYGSWGQALGDDYAGMTPVMLDAWSRVALGWVQPTTAESTGTVSIAAGTNGNIVKLPTRNANEYFLLENRQNVGYDAGLTFLLFSTSFGGIAVWHVDDDVGTPGMNNDNTTPTHKRVDLVAAVGDSYIDSRINYGQQSNLYYAGNVTHVNDTSTPSLRLYDGNNSGAAVSAVSATGSTMTAIIEYTAEAALNITSTDSTNSQPSGASSPSASSGGGATGMESIAIFLSALWMLAFGKHRRTGIDKSILQ